MELLLDFKTRMFIQNKHGVISREEEQRCIKQQFESRKGKKNELVVHAEYYYHFVILTQVFYHSSY